MKIVKTVVTGVGQRARQLIAEGNLSNKEILEIVRQEHPMRKTTYACIAWYRNDAKKPTIKIDTSAADAWAASEMPSTTDVE